MAFIDNDNTFDTAETVHAIRQQGAEESYCSILEDILRLNSYQTYGDTGEVPTRKGVKEGEKISPKLFTSCLEIFEVSL